MNEKKPTLKQLFLAIIMGSSRCMDNNPLLPQGPRHQEMGVLPAIQQRVGAQLPPLQPLPEAPEQMGMEDSEDIYSEDIYSEDIYSEDTDMVLARFNNITQRISSLEEWRQGQTARISRGEARVYKIVCRTRNGEIPLSGISLEELGQVIGILVQSYTEIAFQVGLSEPDKQSVIEASNRITKIMSCFVGNGITTVHKVTVRPGADHANVRRVLKIQLKYTANTGVVCTAGPGLSPRVAGLLIKAIGYNMGEVQLKSVDRRITGADLNVAWRGMCHGNMVLSATEDREARIRIIGNGICSILGELCIELFLLPRTFTAEVSMLEPPAA